jgi:hypothetical protein
MGQPVHGPGPHCVDGDTIVLTQCGPQRIRDIAETGKVLTPCGWKPYRSPMITRRDASLVAVSFTDGLTVNCTAEHLFLTDSGWKCAGDLGPGSEILSCLTRRRSISMAASTAFTSVNTIFQAQKSASMSMFGGLCSVLGRWASTFITATATAPTTSLRTSNAWSLASISVSVAHSAGKPASVQRRDEKRLNGIAPKLAANGTPVTPRSPGVGTNGVGKISHVSIAARLFRRFTGKNIAPCFARASIVVQSVTPLARKADVWCLTVDDPGHWWSLANGAVTHNSHGADAYQTAAVGFHMVTGLSASMLRRGAMRRRLRGVI